MISEILFYCTSHKKINYLNGFTNLNLIACSEKKFDDKWEFIDIEDNINKNFLSYGDLTAHYKIWKTFIKKKIDQKIWVGLCQYRRHWVNDNFNPKKRYSLEDLKEVILINSKHEWKNYDSILTSPFVFKPKLLEKKHRWHLNFYELFVCNSPLNCPGYPLVLLLLLLAAQVLPHACLAAPLPLAVWLVNKGQGQGAHSACALAAAAAALH